MTLNTKKAQFIITILVVIMILMLIVIGILIGRVMIQEQSSIVQTDTITNTQVIETIKTEIVEQEKEIVKYKTEYIYEKENAKNINDSAAVELFYELASE